MKWICKLNYPLTSKEDGHGLNIVPYAQNVYRFSLLPFIYHGSLGHLKLGLTLTALIVQSYLMIEKSIMS